MKTKEVNTMPERLATTLERPETEEAPRMSKARRIWLIVTACLAALLLTAAATFAVHFYFGLQAQQRVSAEQAQQIASLQEALSAQNEQLQKQEEQISSQASEIKEQESTIEEQESTIKEQESTIKAQKVSSDAQKADSAVRPVDGALFADVDVTGLAGKKLVALTFDDGPGLYTARLLDALKERESKATFFLVGTRVNSYASVIKRMEAEGHAVGNHSQNHKNLKSLTASGIATEMGNCAERIKKIIGHYPTVMRCPGGNYNEAVKKYAKDAGVPIIQWDVDTLDWKYRNKASILKRTSGIKDGSIVLMHDIYSTTVDAAIQLMDSLIEQGYTLVTVPELLKAKNGAVEAGSVYF